MSIIPYCRKTNDALVKKRKLFIIKVTTRIDGNLKNHFIDDAIKRGNTESVLARDIIKLYYNILKSKPELLDKEFSDIEKIIIASLSPRQ